MTAWLYKHANFDTIAILFLSCILQSKIPNGKIFQVIVMVMTVYRMLSVIMFDSREGKATEFVNHVPCLA